MRKIIFITSLIFCTVIYTTGQTVGNWQNGSLEDSGKFGAGINKAHAASKGMKPSRKPVTVALIGYGIDIEHEAIKDAIWVNPKEKRNGKDDDKNGWIDDINGWNFLGNDTITLNRISKEGDREYIRLRDKYDSYLIVANGKAYKYDDVKHALVETPLPEDMEEYNYFRKVVAESELAESYRAIALGKAIVWYIHEIDKKLKQQFPDKQLTKEDFETFVNQRRDASEFEKGWYSLISLMFMSTGNDSWDKMVEFADTKYVPYQEQQYERMQKLRYPRDRAIIGDNVYDINDRNYGNNNLHAENSGYGTMIAGIIAGRSGNSQIEGIARNVKIMTLRVDADDYGEAYVKDIALALRYAVDKGADIIQFGKSNTLYPRPYSQWVDSALRYAEKKGVLIVLPVMDYSFNLDEQPFFPNRRLSDGSVLTNIITVAASDSLGNPYKQSNFSKTELDLFAPGVEIRSSVVDNKYGVVSGSAFAAAEVTGVAAFIKSYYPKITPVQMRKLLMDNVTGRSDAEVEKQFRSKGRLATDLFLFSELCASGGILNAEKAFTEAGKLK